MSSFTELYCPSKEDIIKPRLLRTIDRLEMKLNDLDPNSPLFTFDINFFLDETISLAKELHQFGIKINVYSAGDDFWREMRSEFTRIREELIASPRTGELL